jgi:glycosyltransferase involved in cell wall biosynthesis
MHVTFLAQELTVGAGDIAGGAQRSLHAVASRLIDRGYGVTVLTVNSRRNAVEGSVPYDVVEAADSLPTPAERLDRTLPPLMAADDDTDLFHVFGPRFVPGAARYRKRADVPVVARLNSYGVFCFNMARMDGACQTECNVRKRLAHYDGSMPQSIARSPLMAYANHRLSLFDCLDYFFAQSPAVEQIYREVGVADPPMTVVPNIFDANFDCPEAIKSPFEDVTFDVLFTGRLVPEKGVEYLVDAVRELPDDIYIHIVGDGPLLEDVRDAADNLSTLFAYGYVQHNELPPYYRDADLYVHPGTWPDPCPRSVLEALAAGTPLVVTDIGGPPWMAGDACETVPPRDSRALAECITQLFDSPKKLEQLQTATEREIDRFHPSEVLPKYTAVYDSFA